MDNVYFLWNIYFVTFLFLISKIIQLNSFFALFSFIKNFQISLLLVLSCIHRLVGNSLSVSPAEGHDPAPTPKMGCTMYDSKLHLMVRLQFRREIGMCFSPLIVSPATPPKKKQRGYLSSEEILAIAQKNSSQSHLKLACQQSRDFVSHTTPKVM